VCTGFWWGSLRERDHWVDPDVDGRIILRVIFRKWELWGLMTKVNKGVDTDPTFFSLASWEVAFSKLFRVTGCQYKATGKTKRLYACFDMNYAKENSHCTLLKLKSK
jgi:hypothetical protein